MWFVYCRTNKINGKKYIGITGMTVERRWEYEIKNVQYVHDLMKKIAETGENHKQRRKKLTKKLENVKYNIIYDIAMMGDGIDVWQHDVLETHENVVEALLAERRLIDVMKTRDVNIGYNRTDGGEIPKRCTIVDLLDAYEQIRDKIVQHGSFT